jgi:hypothetical protein
VSDYTCSPGAGNLGAVAKYLPSQDNVSFPVQVKLLESFLKHEFIGGVRAGPSYASREREFVRTQNAYASASGAQKQPGKPRQPRWTKTPQGCRELRVALERRMQTWVISCIRPIAMKDIHLAKLMLKCSAFRGGEPPVVSFYAGSAGNSQAGPTPFRFHLIKCTSCGPEVDGQLTLQAARDPHIKSEHVLPIGGGHRSGMMQHFTHWDVAANLLDGNVAPTRIEFAKMICTLLGSDKFVVSGVDPTVESLVVDCTTAPNAQEHAAQANPDVVDWDSGVLPSPIGSTHPKPPAMSSEGFAFGEALDIMHEEVVGCVGVDVASDDSSDTSDSSSSSVADFPVDASSSSNSGGGEVAPPVAEPPTPLNIMETLDSVNNIDMLFARMPDFEMNSRWEITHKPDNQVIGKIRCIQGESLRIDCRCGHVVPCKMHIGIHGRFEMAQCWLIRWLIFGTACDSERHTQEAVRRQAQWRALP